MYNQIQEYTVSKSATIKQSMEVLEKNRKGIVLLIDDNNALLGTIVDGDIRRALLQGYTLDSNVVYCVNKSFTSVNQSVGRAEVLDIMKAMQFQHMPIVDEYGKLLGIHLLKELIGTIERQNIAIIMAGGKGTRLLPLTETLPKPMISVAGRPILERIILHLLGFGIKKIYISINYLGHKIKEYFKNGSSFGCQIEYIEEEFPMGTSGALSLLQEKPSLPFLILNGDLLTQVNIDAMIHTHHKEKNMVTIGSQEYQHTIPFGVIEALGSNVIELIEKPTFSRFINTGIYVVSPEALDFVPHKQKSNMPDIIDQILKNRHRVGLYHIEEDWIDIGQHQQLKQARGE